MDVGWARPLPPILFWSTKTEEMTISMFMEFRHFRCHALQFIYVKSYLYTCQNTTHCIVIFPLYFQTKYVPPFRFSAMLLEQKYRFMKLEYAT